MKLNQLRDNPGARKKPMTVGRGPGSGKGKTSGRGGKGQTARTGVAIKGFEGGQSPLLRRMPKSGFKVPNRAQYVELTLKMLQDAVDAKKIDAGKTMDAKALKAAGVIGKIADGVRVLGTGELKGKVNLLVTYATKGAVAAIEKAGGKVAVLPPKENKLETGKRTGLKKKKK